MLTLREWPFFRAWRLSSLIMSTARTSRAQCARTATSAELKLLNDVSRRCLRPVLCRTENAERVSGRSSALNFVNRDNVGHIIREACSCDTYNKSHAARVFLLACTVRVRAPDRTASSVHRPTASNVAVSDRRGACSRGALRQATERIGGPGGSVSQRIATSSLLQPRRSCVSPTE